MSKWSSKKRIGEALIEEGLLSTEQLYHALGQQKATGQLLGELLVADGVISSTTLVNALARCHGMRGCQLRPGLVDPTLMPLIDEELAERLHVIPLFRVHGTLTVAMAEPQSLPAIDRLRKITGCKINPVLALE